MYIARNRIHHILLQWQIQENTPERNLIINNEAMKGTSHLSLTYTQKPHEVCVKNTLTQ